MTIMMTLQPHIKRSNASCEVPIGPQPIPEKMKMNNPS